MTISLYLILWLLLAHWVGDAVLQSGAVAVRKGKSFATLTYHVAVYTVALTLFVSLAGHAVNHRSYAATPGLLFIGANAVAHWLTDTITSRINSRLWAAGTATTPPNLHWFFTMVLLDQLCHTATLVLTAAWLLS